jgi:hypothetical protein
MAGTMVKYMAVDMPPALGNPRQTKACSHELDAIDCPYARK